MTVIPCWLQVVIIPFFFNLERKYLTFFSDHFQRFIKNDMDAGY